MWSVKYRGGYIQGYFDRDACTVLIPHRLLGRDEPGHERFSAKSLLGAKQLISRRIRP